MTYLNSFVSCKTVTSEHVCILSRRETALRDVGLGQRNQQQQRCWRDETEALSHVRIES